MSENVICEIIDSTEYDDTNSYNKNKIDIDSFCNSIVKDDDSTDSARFDAIYLHYNINYTIKMLGHILDYYNLNKKKNKQDGNDSTNCCV